MGNPYGNKRPPPGNSFIANRVISVNTFGIKFCFRKTGRFPMDSNVSLSPFFAAP